MQMQATAAAKTLATVKHQKTAKPNQATAVKAPAGIGEHEKGGDKPAVSPSSHSNAALSEEPQTDADMAVDDETSKCHNFLLPTTGHIVQYDHLA